MGHTHAIMGMEVKAFKCRCCSLPFAQSALVCAIHASVHCTLACCPVHIWWPALRAFALSNCT